MIRTKINVKKIRIPDAINCSTSKEFTQIPNTILRSTSLSCKAKIVLCILLSNKDGWHSCTTSIQQMLKEGRRVTQGALKELEEEGFLLRVTYRNQKTKTIAGSFWAYTDTKGIFNMDERLEDLNKKGFEIIVQNVQARNVQAGNVRARNVPLKILYNNNTNEEKDTLAVPSTSINTPQIPSPNGGPITKIMFDDFWRIYPKKIDKGKALSKWITICGKSVKEKPTWKEIKRALLVQIKSERWRNPQYIPHPTTWLNQRRWLDDPGQMKSPIEKVQERLENGRIYKLSSNGKFWVDKEGNVLYD